VKDCLLLIDIKDVFLDVENFTVPRTLRNQELEFNLMYGKKV
jgi:hypothetical protein